MGQSTFFAIGLFLIFGYIVYSSLKTERKRKSHREILGSADVSKPTSEDSIFQQNRAKYLNAIKEGKYDAKNLVCRDLYDTEDYFKCLEEVYFGK